MNFMRTSILLKQTCKTCDPQEVSQLQKMLQKPELIVFPEFFPNYKEISFCDPRRIYDDQFASSTFLSFAGL